ncbi:MAG TPA: hypothetical protein VGR26_07505 [Acidimicrobiales bacterium]|nr:hypothetical protein [Acidimicrobiales bacterium]
MTRARAERQAGRASQEARRLEVRGRAIGAGHGIEKRDEPTRGPQVVEAALAEQRRRGARPEQETVRGQPPSALKGGAVISR